VTGSRRGELCGLRWRDVDLDGRVLSVERAISQYGAQRWEKDTKTHRSRRLALDAETVALLTSYKELCAAQAALVDVELSLDAFVFSPAPDGSQHLNPESVGQRYSRRAARLGIKTTIHKLRHYSATELIAAGVDVRTVAGRLGHGGGGTTTLKVYAAWVSEADQRAATGLLTHLPQRPSAKLGTPTRDVDPRNPYELIAADIRSQIVAGVLVQGDALPSRKALAETYRVAVVLRTAPSRYS
jgi:integrase